MKLQKNNSQKNILQVRNLMSIVEKKLSSFDNDNFIVEKLNADELTDFYKILTISIYNCYYWLIKGRVLK